VWAVAGSMLHGTWPAMEARQAIALRPMGLAMDKPSGEAGGALRACHQSQGARPSPLPSTRSTTSSSSSSLNGLCRKAT